MNGLLPAGREGTLDFGIGRHAGVLRIPGDDFPGSKAFLYVNGPLVGGAFEEEGHVFFVQHEFAVHQDVDAL